MSLTASCWIAWTVLLGLNAGGMWLVRHDKRQAQLHGGRANRRANQRGNDRIPEATFHTLAMFGAGPGMLAAMWAIRHKTRKPRFMVPFVLAMAVGVALASGWLWILC